MATHRRCSLLIALAASLLPACGGRTNTLPEATTLTTGENLALVGVEDGTRYWLEWSQPAEGMSYHVRARSAGPSGSADTAFWDLEFLHSAVVWNSRVVVLARLGNDDALFDLGADPADGSFAPLTGAIGMVSNLAVKDGLALVAHGGFEGPDVRRFHPDGSFDDITVPGPSSTYVTSLAVDGDRVCVNTIDSVACGTDRGLSDISGGAGSGYLPSAVYGSSVFLFRNEDGSTAPATRVTLLELTVDAPGASPREVASFDPPMTFDYFYAFNLGGATSVVPDGDWVYVAGREHGLVRARRDGSRHETLAEGFVNTVAIDGDTLYFTTRAPDGSSLRSMPVP